MWLVITDNCYEIIFQYIKTIIFYIIQFKLKTSKLIVNINSQKQIFTVRSRRKFEITHKLYFSKLASDFIVKKPNKSRNEIQLKLK